MKLVAVAMLLACSGKKPEQAEQAGLATGDGYLVIDEYSVQRFHVTSATEREVNGKLFGSPRTHPREAAIPVRDLTVTNCAKPGRVVLVKTTDAMWDLGLTLGTDGERCYLQEQQRASQRDPKIVFDLPVSFASLVTVQRAHFERERARHTWIPQRPAGWLPEAGTKVAQVLGGALREVTVVERRPGAVKLERPGAFQGQTVTDWYSLRRIAPLPASGARRPIDAPAACFEPERTRCVELAPPELVPVPVQSLAGADLIGRTVLLADLRIELGALHTRRPADRPNIIVWIGPDGTPVAEAHYEIAPATATSADEVVAYVEKVGGTVQAFDLERGEVLLFRDMRVVIPPQVLALREISAASRALFADVLR